MAQKIYVIVKGCYSDFHIEAATTDPVRAEELMRLHSDAFNCAYIEEFEDGQSHLSHTPVQYWLVNLVRDGDLDFAFSSFDEPGKQEHALIGLDSFQLQFIRADGQEQAVKIARDRRAELLASDAGIV